MDSDSRSRGTLRPASPGGSPDLAIAEADRLDAGQLARVRDIYAEAFPAHLRVPLAELAATSPRDRLPVALDGGDPVGFAALRLLTGPGWVLLRYFGVAASRRRSGIGLRFWQQLTGGLRSAGWPARMVLEVEDPADATDDPAELAIRRGRIGFWARCGARPLPLPGYVMPALTDIGHPEPMVAMAFDPDGGPLARSDLTALVRAIFTEHYGLAPSHPMVSAALGPAGTADG